MAKHCAKFGLPLVSDVAAVTLKFAGVPQTPEPISAASGPMFATPLALNAPDPIEGFSTSYNRKWYIAKN